MKLALAVLLVGCAQGSSSLVQNDAPNGQNPDAKVWLDGSIEGNDAHVYMDAHVYDDAHVYNDAHVYTDAHVYNDAHVYMDACVPVQTELLANPAFDLAPVATGWTEVQFNAVQEVTSDFVQSAPYSLFLGGWEGYGTVTDQIYQDVMVPANTTALVLTGYYAVGTTETTTTVAYDTATGGLIQTNGTPIESALSVSNLTSTGSGYAALNHSFSVAGLSGTTVRVRFTSTSDDTLHTNFFFDTMSLKATHCP